MPSPLSHTDRAPILRLAQQRLGLLAGQGLCWLAVIGSGVEADPTRRIIFLAGAGVLGLLLLSFSLWASDRRSRADHAGTIAARIDAVIDRKVAPAGFSGNHLLDASLHRIERTVADLRLGTPKRVIEPIGFGDSVELDLRVHLANAMTKSGMYDPASALDGLTDDSIVVGERSAGDMVNRLDPRTLRWIESSQAEQLFLGWSLKQLREKSFLEIIHPDDSDLAREQLRTALSKGEAHGLIYRIKTARGAS